MATARDLIVGALDLINVTGDGMEPSNEMVSKAFTMLNDIIKTWNLQRLMLYKTEEITGILTAGQNPHSIGPSGEIDTGTGSRPVKIQRVFTRFTTNNSVDFTAAQIDSNRYQEIVTKSASTSYPTHFYYKADFPLGYIYMYPVQGQADLEIHITYWMQLEEIVHLTDDVTLPFGYDTALKYQLACDLSPTYGRPVNRGDAIFDRAADLRREIKRANEDDRDVQLDFALSSTNNRGFRFNILRGF
jgi:hypothetical protein